MGRKKPNSMLLLTFTVITSIEWHFCQYHTKKLPKQYKTKSTCEDTSPQESDNIHRMSKMSFFYFDPFDLTDPFNPVAYAVFCDVTKDDEDDWDNDWEDFDDDWDD